MGSGMNLPQRIWVCPMMLDLESADQLVKGRKRPLSSSCPYIVEKDGRPILIGGAAGGSAIITSNIQVARNVLVS